MATAVATGLHSNPAIWDTGIVPVAPESIIVPVGIVVTQDGVWDVGDGAASITIDAGGELITNNQLEYRGHIALNGALTHHGSTDLIATAGSWTITQGAGSVWRTVGGGIKPVFRAAAGYHWLWRDVAATAGYTIDVTDFESYNCGTSSVVGMHQRGNSAASLNIQMRRFLWASCGQLRLGVGATHHVDAVCQIDGIVIIDPLSSGSCLDYAARFPAGWLAGSRYLRSIYLSGTSAARRISTGRKNARANPAFEVSFACSIDGRYQDFGGGYVSVSGPMIMDQYTGNGIEINIRLDAEVFEINEIMVYADRNNAHILGSSIVSPLAQQALVTNSLVEFDSPGGPNFLPHRDGGVKLSNSLIINGNPWYSTAANSIGTSDYEHCTHVTLAGGQGQPSMLQETNEVIAPYVVNGRSNLRVDYRASPTLDFAAIQPSIPTAIDQYTTLDYNCHHIPAQVGNFNPYPTIVITGVSYGDPGFGGSDLFVDPQFQHAPRRMADYDALQGGPGTARNLYYEMFKASGYDRLGNPAVVDPAYSDFRTIKAWVEAAYVPTNPALQGTAHDGGDVGAFAVVADEPLVVSDSLHGHAVEFADLSLSVSLLVDGLAHVHALDDFAVTANYQLLVDGLWHANQLDDVVLSADHQLLVDDVRHALVMDDVQLSGDVVLVVDDLLHDSMSSDLTLFDVAKFIGNHNVIMARSRGRVIIVAKSRDFF